MYVRINKNEIIISKDIFKIIFFLFLLSFFTISIVKIDFNGWVDITLIYLINTIILISLVISIFYKVFSMITKIYSFKSFIIIISILNMILFLIHLNNILFYYTGSSYFTFKFIMTIILTILRNIFSLILSIIIFKNNKKQV